MRTAWVLLAAMLFADTAQAAPLHLIDSPLHPATDDVLPSPPLATVNIAPVSPNNAALAGWSLLEGGASLVTTAGGTVLGSLLISWAVLARPRPSGQTAMGGLLEFVGVFTLSALGLSLAIPLLTSLVVWGIDQQIPGRASYGRILLASFVTRVAALALCFGLGFVFPQQQVGWIFGGVGLAAVGGAVAEVVAARTAPAPAPALPPVASLSLIRAAF